MSDSFQTRAALSVAGRTSTFVGPVVFGSVYAAMINYYTNRGFTEAITKSNSMYWAIGSIVVFLLIGLFFLVFVKKVTPREPLIFD